MYQAYPRRFWLLSPWYDWVERIRGRAYLRRIRAYPLPEKKAPRDREGQLAIQLTAIAIVNRNNLRSLHPFVYLRFPFYVVSRYR